MFDFTFKNYITCEETSHCTPRSHDIKYLFYVRISRNDFFSYVMNKS